MQRHIAALFALLTVAASAIAQNNDPFADNPDAPAWTTNPANHYSMSVFAVSEDVFIPRLMKLSDHQQAGLYHELIEGMGAGDVELIRHESLSTKSGNRIQAAHSRSALAPWFFNMGHVDVVHRYNPRDAQPREIPETFEVDPVVSSVGIVSLNFDFAYSPGQRVTRYYGARYPELSGGKEFPKFVELPAFAENHVKGQAVMRPGNEGVQLVSVHRALQPLAGKTNGWKRSPMLHLCFLKATASDAPKLDSIEPPNHTFVWAAVFELPGAAYKQGITIEELPSTAHRVDFTGGFQHPGSSALAIRSLATWLYPEAVVPEEERGKLGGIEGAMGDFSRNLKPDRRSIGTELEIESVAVRHEDLLRTAEEPPILQLTFQFRRAPVGPTLRETKFAYKDTTVPYNAQKERPYRPAFFDQLDFVTESAEGKLDIDVGRVSSAILLTNTDPAAAPGENIRILFFGLN